MAAAVVALWEVRTDRGWGTFSAEVSLVLTDAKTRGEKSVTVCYRKWTHAIDLVAFTQTNTATGKVRPIRAPPTRAESVGGVSFF